MKNSKLHRLQTHLTDRCAKSYVQQIRWLEDMQQKLTLEGQPRAAWMGLLGSYGAKADLAKYLAFGYILLRLCDIMFRLSIFYSA